MTQKRKTSSKQDIKEALTLLLQEYHFEEISISQLTKKAGINRSTFYLHYVDKYDMMEQLKEETIAHLKHFLVKQDLSNQATILQALIYLKSDYDFIRAISENPYVDFKQAIKDFVWEVIQSLPKIKQHLENFYQIPADYAREVYLASVESIISRWIITGIKESPKEITQIIMQISDFGDWH